MSDPKSYRGEVTSVDVADQIIIGFKRELGALDPVDMRKRIADILSELQKFGATKLQEFIAAPPEKKALFAIAIIRLEGRTFAELQEELKKAAYADVGWFERNAPIVMASYNDPLLPQQWALAKLGAKDLWTVAPQGGNKTIVAIVDSGLRRPDGSVHADLGSVEPVAVCQPPNFFPNCVDSDGHGTFLAGTIAAAPDNLIGVASAAPIAWNIRLLPVQFFDPGVPPNAANAAIGIVWAAANLLHPLHRARVINASWHVAPGDAGLATLKAAILFATIFFDCLIVFAAGNDGTDNEFFPIFPANFGNDPFLAGNVLTVIATDRYDGKAFFSNYGRNTVPIAAPGLRILTTARYLVPPPRFAEYTGTSAAAAHASAGAALVFALNPGWGSTDVVKHLIASADTIEELKIACIGGKRLNLNRAVYGPLHITAPLAGVMLNFAAPTNITWTRDYDNPSFTNVKIEFIDQNGNAHKVGTAPITPGIFAWAPNATVPPLPPTPLAGRIRITPTNGNFPVESGPITIN
jgi:subtilisin family serine protease